MLLPDYLLLVSCRPQAYFSVFIFIPAQKVYKVLKFTHCLFVTFLIGLSTLTAFAQTRTSEVANAELSSVTKVLPDATSPTGVVILYNPSKCQQIGLACDFLLTHEQRRIALG